MLIFIAVLFALLTPGILIKLPPKASPLIVALTHGLVFALIYCLVHKRVFKMLYGYEEHFDDDNRVLPSCPSGSTLNNTSGLCIDPDGGSRGPPMLCPSNLRLDYVTGTCISGTSNSGSSSSTNLDLAGVSPMNRLGYEMDIRKLKQCERDLMAGHTESCSN